MFIINILIQYVLTYNFNTYCINIIIDISIQGLNLINLQMLIRLVKKEISGLLTMRNLSD